MGRPKGNGLVELIDDNADRGRGFFCMDLVMHMWKDEAVKEIAEHIKKDEK